MQGRGERVWKAIKKRSLFLLLLIYYLTMNSLPAFATTYYVRPDGGTATQCNGLANAPYPGSGTNQNCAWNHPFWALNEQGQWKIQGGDTLVIGSGSYEMGMGAPNTGWCGDRSQYNELAFACVLPPLPSGTPGNPTRILGEGWDNGCLNPPELWGHGGIRQILSLEGTSNVEIQCLELTDHSSCGGFYSGDGHRLPMYCSYPVGNYAQNGIFATDSSNVLLRNLNIHGFGDSGIVSARLSNWTLENVRLAGNGMSGWNGDTGEKNVSNSGKMILRRVTVEWNGCPESYPSKEPANCFAQTFNGYGDGIGMGRTGGNWIIEDSVFRYNVSDGLDLLYAGVGHPATVRVERTKAYGNAGNQLKVGGSSTFINNVVVGNCDYFYGKPFAPYFSPDFGADHCRAGGGAVVISLSRGNTSQVINNTIAGRGWALFEVQCATRDFENEPACTGSERVYIQNNVIIGSQDVVVSHQRPGEQNLADLLGDGVASNIPCKRTTDVVHFDWNVIYNAQTSFDDLNLLGPHDIITDPMVVNSDFNNFDGRLREGSPAIDSGLPVGSLNGLVPSSDIRGVTRPQGSGVDRGAYEYTGVPDYTLTVTKSGTGSGNVSASGCTLSWNGKTGTCTAPAGTQITLTATPSSNSTFAGWSGACSGNGTCSVILNSDLNVTATFNKGAVPNFYTLTVTKSGNGSGEVISQGCTLTWDGNVGTCKAPAGNKITLIAQPGSNCTFSGWGGACSGNGTCTITLNSDLNVIATFNKSSGESGEKVYSLVVEKFGSGSGTVQASGCNFVWEGNAGVCTAPAGTKVTLIAKPDSQSTFAGWGGACSGNGTCTITLNSDTSVTATFNKGAPKLYTLKVTKSGTGSGEINVSGCDFQWTGKTGTCKAPVGREITLTASPDANSVFIGWSGGGCSGNGTCTITLNANTNVKATFNKNKLYTLKVTKVGDGEGEVGVSGCEFEWNGKIGQCTAPAGTQITLMASADANSLFAGWGGACAKSGKSEECEVTLKSPNTNVTATFKRAYVVSISKGGEGYGEVEVKGCEFEWEDEFFGSCKVLSGSRITLIAKPNEGSVFEGWEGIKGCSTNKTCTFTVKGDVEGEAIFGIKE